MLDCPTIRCSQPLPAPRPAVADLWRWLVDMEMKPVISAFIVCALFGCAHSSNVPDPLADRLTGRPSWFPLGGEVYQEGDRTEAAKHILAFRNEPHWFKAFPRIVDEKEFRAYRQAEIARVAAHGGTLDFDIQAKDAQYPIPQVLSYPSCLEDIPLNDRGARLDFNVFATDDPHILRFVLNLGAGGRPIWREVEHRWTNILPFLFAFFQDGKALAQESVAWAKMGGANDYVRLAEKGELAVWQVNVDVRGIDSLLGSTNATTLHVVAAFSERQHEGYFGTNDICRPLDTVMSSEISGPQVVVRSKPVRLNRIAGKWLPQTTRQQQGGGYSPSATRSAQPTP